MQDCCTSLECAAGDEQIKSQIQTIELLCDYLEGKGLQAGVKPSLQMCHSRMSAAYHQQHSPAELDTIYRAMLQDNVTPNIITYSYLLRSCGNHNRGGMAKHYLTEAREKGAYLYVGFSEVFSDQTLALRYKSQLSSCSELLIKLLPCISVFISQEHTASCFLFDYSQQNSTSTASGSISICQQKKFCCSKIHIILQTKRSSHHKFTFQR